MAPARLAATGGCGSKPGQSETKCSDGSRSWIVSSEPGDQRLQPVSGVEVALNPLPQHAPLVLEQRLRRLAVLG